MLQLYSPRPHLHPSKAAVAKTNAETLGELAAQACESGSITARLLFGKVVLKRQEQRVNSGAAGMVNVFREILF